MSSFLGRAPNRGSRRRREAAAPPECGIREVQIPRTLPEDSAGVEFQKSSSVGESCSSVSESTVDVEQKVHFGSVQKSKRSHQNVSEKRKQIPDWGLVSRLMWEVSLINMDRRTSQEIDRALEIAINNLEHLKTAEEILEQLVTEAKQEEGKTASIIDTTFTDFIAALNSRKRKLQTELVLNTSSYVTDVHKVQLSIIEKKSSLDGAIKVARGLKAKNSFKSCHSLRQVLCNLKTTIEDEVSKLDNLKKRTLPRFYIDGDKSTSQLENMGEILLDKTDLCHCGEGSLKPSSMEQGCKSGSLFRGKTKHDPLIEENNPKIFAEEYDVQLDGTHAQIQQMAQSPTPKYLAALPQTVCAPDVIIEEIIEDSPGSSSTEYPEDAHHRKLFPKQLLPFGVKADSPELVLVSCVINPCHFYVRMLSQKKMLVHLEKILKQFCKSKNTSPTDILELGAKVFVKSKEHGSWCRATVIELIPKQNTKEGKPCGPTKCKICDVAMMQVFFIDFGHSEALTVSRFASDVAVNPEHATLDYLVTEDLCSVVRIPDFLIEAQLGGIKKLALRCSLKDIVPKRSSEGWSTAARTEFLKMVNNKTVQMRVFREEDGVLIVDLMKPPTNKISSDMPISLRDALVFSDLASLRTELADQSENSVPLQYCPPVMPQENTEAAVVVTYIISPGDFYIQMLESPELVIFLKKIEEVYKTESGDNLEILCPIQGQPCIAKFEDGVWYRAQVIGLPGHQQAEVKYVDYGNTAKINVKDMRKIKDEFLASPAKAIQCKLANIEPFKGTNKWSSMSKHRFEEMVHEKVMLCFFTEILPDNALSVELYESVPAVPNVSRSINSRLVNEGLASYVTRNPQITTLTYNEVWDPPPEDIFAREVGDLNPGCADLSQMEDLALECNKELQVQISRVVSPSMIFLHLLSAEKLLNSLQEKMSATYNMSEEEEAVQWEINMNCAADVHGLDQWNRGQVCKIVSKNTVEVFFFDLGITKTVNTIRLRKLDEKLMSVGPLAVECFLADIRPAGGTDQWTATACDTLTQYLSGAMVKIIIQENTSPFPVKMFHKDDGLYTDVSEYMIKKGLAFRKRRTDIIRALPEKLQEIPVKQENTVISNSNAIGGYMLSSLAPEREADIPITDCEEKESEKSVDLSRAVVTYKPPAIPSVNQFSAVVSCVADNGTIYVIPKSQEQQLSKMMNDIQNNVKCLGLLEPYSWKQGEACVVRGPDTLWYRGEVTEVGSGTIRVRYLDFGYIEKIPQCHLYPTVLYADIPPFSIPCQLHKTKPVGSTWQQDAVELLQELLTKRLVSIHIEKLSDQPWGNISVKLFFSGMSLSSFMAYHKHCIAEEEDGDIPKLNIAECSEEPLEENCEISYEELLLSEIDTPHLPPYTFPPLPILGALFPVKVTHIVLPNEVYICLDQPENSIQQADREDSRNSLESDCKTLKEALTWWNQNIESCPCLTDFRNEMPCLAQYIDGSWYRAKLLSVKEFNPLLIMVLFVDYGATEKLPTSRLRQIPPNLMQYPAQAFKVLLAGFKPPLCDSKTDRIPYCPEWSLEALWTMIDCVQGKSLQASLLTHSPDHTVFLYNNGCLVHMKLVEMGLAALSQ
ncbi:RING finger protein 17 [Heteronotia binoei]|uniref:RING finger protein 17 n=1 Tax=Heteronotia binoei TaxID=13085 RepID=UPI00292F8DBF|nr:RING finger protein 17 [Heteronotia binoei]